jgi:phosphoribosylamine-glycine ligase
MAGLGSKTVLIFDYGQFVELAITLSKSFGRTLYYAPWIAGGNPTSRMLRIGQGFEGVERVEEIWPHIDDVDLFVFPDVYEAGLQEYLVGLGKRVWGCRSGAELELDRPASKELSKKLGIDIAPYTVVEGFDALRKHLKTHKDVFVKISGTRGDMETFHSPDYAATEQRLDELEHNLGAHKKIMEFVVEDAINDAVEIGYDGYTVDGRFPQMALAGVEAKCKAYVGRTMRYRELPKDVRSINDKLAPALQKYGYRGFLSTEIRCNDDGAYLIDPCARCGTPPNEVYQVMIKNLAEILWEGAQGVMLEPEYAAKCGAMVLLQSEWGEDNWQHVSFPESIRAYVKLHNATVIDGEYYVVPHMDRRAQIGAVIGMGDTADAAIKQCKERAEQVEGYTIEKPVAALDEAREQLDEILGPEKKVTRLERQAEELRRAGKISDRQYERMVERVTAGVET